MFPLGGMWVPEGGQAWRMGLLLSQGLRWCQTPHALWDNDMSPRTGEGYLRFAQLEAHQLWVLGPAMLTPQK